MVPTAPRTLTSLPNTNTDSQIRNALFTVLDTLKQQKYFNLEKTINNNIFGITRAGFLMKWHLSMKNEHRNSIVMMHHYPDLGSISDCGWNKFSTYQKQPHQYEIYGLTPLTSFHDEPIGGLQNVSCFLRGYFKITNTQILIN